MQTQLYFNTTHLTGPELSEAFQGANRQENRILDLMAKGRPMTPFDVLEAYNRVYPKIPITSCRRAMTCLTDKGLLRKCDEMREGEFGKKNHTWQKL